MRHFKGADFYTLSPFQRDLILSVCPPGARVVAARYVREWLQPCPVHVRVALPHGGERALILRLDRSAHGVAREAKLLPCLAALGLPVPDILAGPVRDPTRPALGLMSVYTCLPGASLLAWGYRAKPSERPALAAHVYAAILRLQRLTGRLAGHAATRTLPQRTLGDELRALLGLDGRPPWSDDLLCVEAVERLLPLVERVRTPLTFSNGDYNPDNFLFDGRRLAGFVDFAEACFEDPLFGIAKFMTWDWLPYDAAALTRRYIKAHGFTTAELDLRVALACLWQFQRFVRRVLRATLDRMPQGRHRDWTLIFCP